MIRNDNYAREIRMPSFQERFWELKGDKTFEVIAKAIGSNKSSLSQFVSGKLNIRQEMVEALANYFDVDPDYLVGKTDIKRRIVFTKDWTAFIERVHANGVTIDEVEEALQIVKSLQNHYHKKNK